MMEAVAGANVRVVLFVEHSCVVFAHVELDFVGVGFDSVAA